MYAEECDHDTVKRNRTRENRVYDWICSHWDRESAFSCRSRSSIIDDRLRQLAWYDVVVYGDGVTLMGNLVVDGRGGDLPFEICAVKGTDVVLKNTASLRGLPEVMDDVHLALIGTKSFDGAPRVFGREDRSPPLSLRLDVESLSGIHRHFRSVFGTVCVGSNVERDVLGLLKIDGITKFKHWRTGAPPGKQLSVARVVDILNACLQDRASTASVLVRAQRELIDAGLEEYAGL